MTDNSARLDDVTNFLASELIDIRDHLGGTSAADLAVQSRLTAVARILERIGRDAQDPMPADLPTFNSHPGF